MTVIESWKNRSFRSNFFLHRKHFLGFIPIWSKIYNLGKRGVFRVHGSFLSRSCFAVAGVHLFLLRGEVMQAPRILNDSMPEAALT